MRIWTDYLALTAILYNEFLVTYYDKLYYSLSVVIIGTSFIQITIKPKVANLLFLLLQPLKS
jgi:5-methylcytosine-specific restriction endonuclease McrBC GTP-binding regulatory subunit McrB